MRVQAAAAAAVVALLLNAATYAMSAPDRISVLSSLQIDAAAYDAIAARLSESRSIDAIPPLQPPGFVTFLALVYAIAGHSWTAGRLALWACLVAATAFSALLARDMYRSSAAAWTAALLCAASPALLAYAGTLQYELLAAALAAGLLYGVVRLSTATLSHRASLARVAWLGLAAGLAALTREVLVVLVPIVAVYVYQRAATAGHPKRHAAGVAAVWIVCALAVPAAWSALQSSRTGRLVALSDKGPAVLAFGNNPAANGTFNAPLTGVPSPAGWEFIRSRPRAALRLAGRKVLYFLGILRDGWNVPRPSAIVAARAVGGVVPLEWILPWARGGLLLLLLLIALARWRVTTWRASWLVPATVAAVMVVHAVTVSSHRFAIPVLPLVFAVVAGPLASAALTVWGRRSLRLLATVAVLTVAAMQLPRWPLTYELEARAFDGRGAEDAFDEAAGGVARVADPGAGSREVLLLVDEYFPGGTLDVEVTARTDGTTEPEAGLFRLALVTGEGAVACERIARASEVGRDRMTTIAARCELPGAGPATFLVETLAKSRLVFGTVRFRWRR